MTARLKPKSTSPNFYGPGHSFARILEENSLTISLRSAPPDAQVHVKLSIHRNCDSHGDLEDEIGMSSSSFGK